MSAGSFASNEVFSNDQEMFNATDCPISKPSHIVIKDLPEMESVDGECDG